MNLCHLKNPHESQLIYHRDNIEKLSTHHMGSLFWRPTGEISTPASTPWHLWCVWTTGLFYLMDIGHLGNWSLLPLLWPLGISESNWRPYRVFNDYTGSHGLTFYAQRIVLVSSCSLSLFFVTHFASCILVLIDCFVCISIATSDPFWEMRWRYE